MAEFEIDIVTENGIFTGNVSRVVSNTFDIKPVKFDAADVGGFISTYIQRIFDTSLNQYVQYSTVNTFDKAPAAADTTPNHTGNIDEDTHEILKVFITLS